ncbi:MAG: glycosyltransferase family 2 protein [Polaromonas sp.]|nr:glycosyltransferase family 2 protein [Polaromonas sp.]
MNWFSTLLGRYTADDLQPCNELQVIDGVRHRYVSLGIDPRFCLRKVVKSGWYMLEVRLRLPTTFAQTKLYIDTGGGEIESTALGLQVRTEKLAKRLVYLPKQARLRFDPMDIAGAFEIQHLRLTRVTGSFALKRMQNKLNRRHSAYATFKDQSAQPEYVKQLWADYCKVFELETYSNAAVAYADWIAEVEASSIISQALQATQTVAWKWQPTFSIVTPVFNTDAAALRSCLDSVLAQTYPHWELCIANDCSTLPHVRTTLAEYAQRDARIKVMHRTRNGHIVEASNSALALATGDFIVLLDHDDMIAPHALFAVASAIQRRPSAQLLYSDEDKLSINGERCSPFFKPDFSPDLLYSQNYFSHLGVYRHELIRAVGGFRTGFEGSQDYDLVLRCLERVEDVQDVLHVPMVLYHWRMAEGSTASGHAQKPYTTQAAHQALQNHFNNQGLTATVSVVSAGIYRHRWAITEPAPLVTLIIPTRDGHDILKICIESIITRTTYPHYEILIVDNQSTCSKTLAYLGKLNAAGTAKIIPYDHAFNYSAINNFAAGHAQGTLLGLINNDVEVISADWLTEMVSHAVRPQIGCVGAKLYYPNDTIQHGGVVLGIGGVAGHSHKYYPRTANGYFDRLRVVHNVSAVTGAALLLRKHLFNSVGGFDATGLAVAFNDVDLCLKVMAAGYRNLWTPFAELYHHESISRGDEDTTQKKARFRAECDVMQRRWGPLLANDPYYNRNLSLEKEDFSLGILGGRSYV